jgi:hypothetical protein
MAVCLKRNQLQPLTTTIFILRDSIFNARLYRTEIEIPQALGHLRDRAKILVLKLASKSTLQLCCMNIYRTHSRKTPATCVAGVERLKGY